MTTVLVIDDDPQMQNLLVQTMESNGYAVATAGDGRAALNAIERSVPDVVIADLIMPDHEGIELILKLRKSHPALPIIAVSGGGRIDARNYLKLAEQCGARRAFTKPFRLDDILSAVRELAGHTC